MPNNQDSPTPGKAYPALYQKQLAEKIAHLEQSFSQLQLPGIEVFESIPSHFRMRAEFKIWKKEGKASFVMFDKSNPKVPIEIHDFSIGSEKINHLMAALHVKINNCDELRFKLFQVEFLTSTTGDSVTTLIYHRKLDENWTKIAEELSTELKTKIIGRSKGQKLIIGGDDVIEEFNVDSQKYYYQQVETSFTQPNAYICEKMLNWACSLNPAQNTKSDDLLELYCGNGNFTLPLSQHFRNVLATEISKSSVKSATFNIEKNKIDNIKIARLSSEEFVQAINGEREFYRLRDIDLNNYTFSTVFVDPPRAGLDAETEKLVQKFDNIIYISCNPNTLLSNLNNLTTSHKIERFAVFDQFPYTNHLECGVFLTKN